MAGSAPLSPACAGEGQGMNGGWLQSTEWRPSPPLPLLYGGHNGATAVGRGRKAGRELKEKGERETERPNVLFLSGGRGGRTAGAILSTSFRDEENWAGKKGRAAQNSTLLYFPSPPRPSNRRVAERKRRRRGYHCPGE